MEASCFKCNAAIEVEATGTVAFKQHCQKCLADSHCCRNCAFYSPSSYNECKETSAERVVDKEKANFCDYFRLKTGSQDTDSRSESIKKLDDLFK
jgi:hypothetical protein